MTTSLANKHLSVSFESADEIALNHSYAYLSLDHTNRFLLGADDGQGFVDVYALDESGTPGQRVTALNEGRSTAHCILTTPDNTPMADGLQPRAAARRPEVPGSGSGAWCGS